MAKDVKKDFDRVRLKLSEIIPYEKNPRKNDAAVATLVKSIQKCGYCAPIVIDEDNVILAGHTRLKALKRLKWSECDCVRKTGLTEKQKRRYRLLDNKIGELAEWDDDLLRDELDETDLADDLDFAELDWGLDDLDDDDGADYVEDNIPDAPEEATTKLGDVWKLGAHRLICGDSTDAATLEKLMNGEVADLVFTDPPYGMKKEAAGVLNDNLNADDLLAFNRKWIALSFKYLKGVGSWYCWGTDEPLMDIYGEILKPMIQAQELTFRNLITWDKAHGQGQTEKSWRMYPIADEKCLFVMKGVQGFNDNAENYYEGFEPIRKFFEDEKKKSGLTTKQLTEIDSTRCTHYWARSQFEFPNAEGYAKLQDYCKAHGINAFGVEYGKIKREYEEIKAEYEEIKRKYYATRAYFDNTHDNMNNVWHFPRTSLEEREHTGGHATPKPIALCARGIKSSTRAGEIVLDVFGGSGSTLIACEETGRVCRMVELSPKYCDVIVKRWEALTGEKAVKYGTESNG